MVSVGELRRKYGITEDQARTLMVLVEHRIAESTSAKLVKMSPKLISTLSAPVAAEIIFKDLKEADYSLKKFQEIKKKKSELKEKETKVKRTSFKEWKKRRRR